MPYIDKEMEYNHVVEERKLCFEEFVKEQKATGSSGMRNAALCSNGHRDFYGSIEFVGGRMHQGLWVFEPGKHPRVLIYRDRKAAQKYAKDLLPLLKNGGYGSSKVWVEKIAVRNLQPNNLSALMSPGVSYESGDCFVIRMRVQ